jgi:transcriptional regulator GlxA family with amidase domain
MAPKIERRQTRALACPEGAELEGLDPRIRKALRAMQAEPARPWTVKALAKLAGASRSAFAKVFVASLGETPHAWLTRARLQLARELLETSGAKLAEIAGSVGYASEFALSRAFKRHYGVAPGIFRQRYSSAPFALRCAA